jgi:hypothetical protein
VNGSVSYVNAVKRKVPFTVNINGIIITLDNKIK